MDAAPQLRPYDDNSPAKHVDPALQAQAAALLSDLLKGMFEKRASDLHIRSSAIPIYRIDGNLIQTETIAITPALAGAMLNHMLTPPQLRIFEAKNDIDFSHALTGFGRFRGNAFRQRGSVAIVLRQIPTQIPNFTDLYLPKVMPKFCQLSRGLVLVCGVTGSGKSTTLAAMLENVNQQRAEHIVTIEDPIEFLYKDKNPSSVSVSWDRTRRILRKRSNTFCAKTPT